MDYLKTYKSFVNSQHLSEGVRITLGVLLPAVIMSYFDMLATGISISLGALFVSITDSAGPIHHRRNGMIVCIATISLASLLTGFFVKSPILLVFFLFIASFFFSMISIYGTRAASIGTATLIIITLSTDTRLSFSTPGQIIQHSLLIASGGLWYMCFSMLLYTFRPYRLAQQALGDYVQSIAEYLLLRVEFFSKEVNYENTYSHLLQQQAVVQHKQTELTELLFKTRSIVKESTDIGRRLVMIHLDAADIFERIIMSHQEYSLLHKFFDDETNILNDYYLVAKDMAIELDEVGIAIKSGVPYNSDGNISQRLVETRVKLDHLRETFLNPENIDGFISLRLILENLQDLSDRLTTLEKYTQDDIKALRKRIVIDEGHKKMLSSQRITTEIFINNLTLKSDTFRHSSRVSIAMIVGFMVTQLAKTGHSYWVLLTIVVILKPAFSLSKKRNRDRIAGTVAGIIIGVIILSTITNSIILFVLLVLFMAGSYTFMRTNYFISVLLMTPYLVLFYYILNPLDFQLLLKDRIIDTLIGSFIAFIASIFLFPSWEREKIKPAMANMITEVRNYFSIITASFDNKITTSVEHQIARKDAMVALANLSDAFNRMLSEPKNQQQDVETIHQFVVLTHTLTSYIATLSYYTQMKILPANSDDFKKVAEDIEQNFTNAINYLCEENVFPKTIGTKDSLRVLNEDVNTLLQKRKQELEQGYLETSTRRPLFELKSITDQFNLIYNVAVDINKIAQKLGSVLK